MLIKAASITKCDSDFFNPLIPFNFGHLTHSSFVSAATVKILLCDPVDGMASVK